MFAPVPCCFDVMFLLFASLFALSVHQALNKVAKKMLQTIEKIWILLEL